MSDVVLERIAGWEAAGLIDAATAERLRAAEAAAGPHEEPAAELAPASVPSTAPRAAVASSFFGPAVSVVEMFSYLGGAFILAAASFLVARLMGEAPDETTRLWILVAGQAVAAAVFFVLGLAFHGRSARLSRAAGVCFVLSVSFVQSGVTANAGIFVSEEWALVAGAIAGVLAAVAYRWLHPAVLTEFALLATITGLVFVWLDVVDLANLGIDSAIAGAAIASAFWIGCGILIGLIALFEASSGGPEATRRAALARFWAGIVVVVGVAEAVMRTQYTDFGGAQRIIEPAIGELIVLGISAVLVQRAFRRNAGAYVLAAAVGVVVAFTDFNFSYVADAGGTEVALLIEGLVLIAIAFAADRLSKRVGDREPPPPLPAGDGSAVESSADAASV